MAEFPFFIEVSLLRLGGHLVKVEPTSTRRGR
jgi:hypothetical protein